jgi:hypothetical protein
MPTTHPSHATPTWSYGRHTGKKGPLVNAQEHNRGNEQHNVSNYYTYNIQVTTIQVTDISYSTRRYSGNKNRKQQANETSQRALQGDNSHYHPSVPATSKLAYYKGGEQHAQKESNTKDPLNNLTIT